ncbi:hypothetical protein V2K23_03350 [Pseudomonas alliivorans]|nr:hypothetical protein [Pseudomonas alliivorans]
MVGRWHRSTALHCTSAHARGGVKADVLKKLAIALHVTSNFLLFETDERGPDDRLRYQFEAISRMPMEEQELVRGLLDAVIVKHQVAGAIARAAGPATKRKE